MAKSELISVRVEEETADRIQELVDQEQEEAPEMLSELDVKGEPQVLRKIIRVGLDTVAEGESDVQRLRDRIEDLESEVDRLEAVKNNPSIGDWIEVTRRAPAVVKLFLYPAATAAGLFFAGAIGLQVAEVTGVGGIRGVATVLVGLSFLVLLLAVVSPVAQILGGRVAEAFDR